MKQRRSAAAFWLLVFAFLLDVALVLFSRLDAADTALVHVGAFSALAFVAFTWDKIKAAAGSSTRVREATLLAFAILGGALGALIAMLFARHKSRKKLFWFVVLGALFVHVTVVGWLFIKR
jgi:uncharacterized membrane protein YsdA (DUF1294 family)